MNKHLHTAINSIEMGKIKCGVLLISSSVEPTLNPVRSTGYLNKFWHLISCFLANS